MPQQTNKAAKKKIYRHRDVVQLSEARPPFTKSWIEPQLRENLAMVANVTNLSIPEVEAGASEGYTAIPNPT